METDSIIMQLVFEHSLRIRMKAESSDSDSTANQNDTKNSKAMTGKINNLITTDVSNIGDGSDILELGMIVLFVQIVFQV